MLAPPQHYDLVPEDPKARDFQSIEHPIMDLLRLLAAIKRQLSFILAIAILGGVCGLIYAYNLQPRYTASTLLLIDNRRVPAVENSYDGPALTTDTAASIIDSQVEVMKSEKVASGVVRKLDLLNDPEFSRRPSQPGLLKRVQMGILGILGSVGIVRPLEPELPIGNDESARLHAIAIAVQRDVDVRRVGRTMVLEITYTAETPQKAARFANGYAEAYLADQLDAKYEATKRASTWLEDRMNELKQKALTSDLAVQKFKADHNLIASGGRLINEQQLQEVNTQLVLSRADTAKAEARYQRIEAIINGHQTDAIVSEAIGNAGIEQLRSKYLDASKRQAEISAKLGKDHQQAVYFRNEMAEYERLMFQELGRLAESYRSEVDITRSREQSLKASLDQLSNVSTSDNKTLVSLRELEREGDAYRNLHQSYLQRFQEALQQQSFPIIDARIITSATPPGSPSYPKKAVILILFIFAGGAIGCAAGYWRESRERGFQSEEQVRADLGVECLGMLPVVKSRSAKPSLAGPFQGKGRLTVSSEEVQKRAERITSSMDGIMTYAIDNPASAYAETLLAVKLAADLRLAGQTSKIIGIISALPGEGKTTFSKNFASLIASLKSKTLLIDADLRGPELTRRAVPGAMAGLVEAVIEKQPLQDLLWTEEQSGLRILPGTVSARSIHASELLASNGMKTLLAEAENQFEYVVVDLPPLGPVVDVRAVASQIQAFVLVAQWRQTARKVVRSLLTSEQRLYEKCLGTVLNKVNLDQIKMFENPGSRYFYYDEYSKSYYGGNNKARQTNS
jgi:succinoglycan biosynthesis transport protein ExoP